MKIFGWKSAGRALARPGKTHVPLARPFGSRFFGGGGLGEWPQSYEAQLREGYLQQRDCAACGAVGGGGGGVGAFVCL